MKSSKILALGALMLGASQFAHANLVTNGDFETGDFTGWTLFGNTGFTGVASGNGVGGSYGAYFGAVGTAGGIYQQTLATVAGATYTFSFDLANDGGTFNSVDVQFDGASVLSGTNLNGFGFTPNSYSVIASTASTTISFAFQQDPAYYYLDNVSVVQSSVPDGGSTVALLGVGVLGVVALRRKLA